MLWMERLQEETIQNLQSVQVAISKYKAAIKTLTESMNFIGRHMEAVSEKVYTLDGKVF